MFALHIYADVCLFMRNVLRGRHPQQGKQIIYVSLIDQFYELILGWVINKKLATLCKDIERFLTFRA